MDKDRIIEEVNKVRDRVRMRNDAAFEENKHPRDNSGKFTSNGAGSGSSKKSEKTSSASSAAEKPAWKYAGKKGVGNVSYEEAESLFDAPVGTTISMSSHESGDYIGEYVRTANGWEGKQKYRSSRKTPPNVNTSKGFAMQVVGTDVKFS